MKKQNEIEKNKLTKKTTRKEFAKNKIYAKL